MKVIIVDDSQDKVEIIRSWVLECVPQCEVQVADCAHEGIRQIQILRFDLVILDVLLPFVSGGSPTEEAAVWFVDEIGSLGNGGDVPLVIGATQYPDAKGKVEAAFGKYLWSVVVVEGRGGAWRMDMKRVLEFVGSTSVQIHLSSQGRRFDGAILTALRQPEFHAVISAFGDGERIVVAGTNENWVSCIVEDTSGTKRSVIVACAEEMGMSAMSALTTRVILACRPKFMILAGIMGGNRDHVGLGDVIAVDETWDCRAGKLTEDGFEADVRSLPGAMALRNAALGALTRSEMMTIAAGWAGPQVGYLPMFRHGAVACSPAVLAYDKAFEELSLQKRKVLGVEMEAFGCYSAASQLGTFAPRVVALKSVCDLGDKKKSDTLQSWCAYVSAESAKRLLRSSVLWE